MTAMDNAQVEVTQDKCFLGCDSFGPNRTCSGCTGLLERNDGSVVDQDGNIVSPATTPSEYERGFQAAKDRGKIIAARECTRNRDAAHAIFAAISNMEPVK